MDNETLVADLIEFVSCKPRAYEEVMDAWRTSCPRLAIWEDAVDNGLLSRKGRTIVVTDKGKRFVERLRPDSIRYGPLGAQDTTPFPPLPGSTS